jgi:hypothetical protein
MEGEKHFAEVLWFAHLEVDKLPEKVPVALIRPYTDPDPFLLEHSHGALISIRPEEEVTHRLIHAKCIDSVVGFIPFRPDLQELHARGSCYVLEHLGLEMVDDNYDLEDENADDEGFLVQEVEENNEDDEIN